MSLLPMLPIIVPLVGILVCTSLKYPVFDRLTRRGMYTIVLGLTALALALLRIRGAALVPDMRLEVGYLTLPAAPLWSPLSYWSAALVLLVLLLGQVADWDRPLTAARSVHYLTILSATMATVSAANTVSLALAWCIPQWIVLYLRVSQSDAEEGISRWDAWAGLASMALVILGITASTAEQSGTLYLVELGPGLAFTSLALAAALRLLSWPLATGPGRWWQLHAMSLATGFYLWLRLGIALKADGPLASYPLVTVAAGLTLGLLIGPRKGKSRVVPYGLGYWLAVSFLAPLLDPEYGFAVSLLTGTQLMLCLLLLRGYDLRDTQPIAIRLSRLIAPAALSGTILTSGFVAQWLFGQICLRTGGLALLAVASAGFVVAAIPFWHRMSLLSENGQDETDTHRRGTLPYASVAVSGLLILLGIWPGILDRLWPELRVGLDALGYAHLWGEGGAERLALFLAVLVIPLAAGLVGRRTSAGWAAADGWTGKAERGFRSEWLYLIGQRLLARATGAIRVCLVAIEGSLALGWCALWLIALVFYLLQR